MMNRWLLLFRKAILVTCLLMICWACGDGGSNGGNNGGNNSGNNATDNPLTGYFVDGPVEGLRFNTATQSGYTDSSGAFHYMNGEVVSFYVGDILIGQADGASQITPFDLAGIAPPLTNLEVQTIVAQMDSEEPTQLEMTINIAVF
ncbi:MAG: hypothetical protein P8Z37_05140, partial [Acidobacteriota bacterium]